MARRARRRWWQATAGLLLFQPTLAVAQAADVAPSAKSGDEKQAPGAPDDEDKMPPPGYVPGYKTLMGAGLSPYAPGQQTVLPAGIAPAFGAPVAPVEGSKLDFQGYVQAGARASLGERKNASADQHITTWHGDPLVPRGNVFENTNNVPYTWAELRFMYSQPRFQSVVSLGAWSLAESGFASGSFMANAQLWVRDAYMTYTPFKLDKSDPLDLTWRVGVYEDRYGAMAQYSTGQYGAPVIATIAGVGETLTAQVPAGGVKWFVEHGIKSNLGRPPANAPVGPTNNWLKPWEGQTFVNHLHAGLDYRGRLRPALHYIGASARDDTGDHLPLGSLRAGHADYAGGSPETYPEYDHADASLRVLGADVHVNMDRFGYLVVGASQTKGKHVRTINGVVQVLNSGGGRDLLDRYFGRNNDMGRGSLYLVGLEYNMSLGTLLRYPGEFWGEGPDLLLSLFGLYGQISADDPARDGEKKIKFGAEGVYSVLPWLALAGRFDRSTPYLKQPDTPLYPNQNDNTFNVLTAKAVLRSGWQARETLTLQYSNYIYRSNYHLVTLNAGGQVSSVTDEPDRHLVAVYGTLWW